jgi:guanine deaminase
VISPLGGELLRAPLFHTPRNPFVNVRSLQHHSDGGLLIRDGRIAACGDYETLRAAHRDARTTDLRGGFLLPGLVDTHVHFPQLRVLGSLGRSLLDWLDHSALPEEVRMADVGYARQIAGEFVRALASHGTTTALVFGPHFPAATAELFQAADAAGLRVISGMVLSDRRLRAELHQHPGPAYRDSTELITRFHGCGRLLYAITPRFAMSASEEMLEVCQTLLREHDGLRVTSHINENPHEVAEVAKLFPWAEDYLAVYEKFGLTGRGAVMAHNIHTTYSELERLAAGGTAVAHCPCSNAALGSGVFPMRQHLESGVRCALGTDVGGGTGFGMLKEAMQAYLMQRTISDGITLDGTQLLYLATLAGAEAVGLESEIGDFSVGKSADLVYVKPPAKSVFESVVTHADSPERVLDAIFTLAGQETIQQVWVGGTSLLPCHSRS